MGPNTLKRPITSPHSGWPTPHGGAPFVRSTDGPNRVPVGNDLHLSRTPFVFLPRGAGPMDTSSADF